MKKLFTLGLSIGFTLAVFTQSSDLILPSKVAREQIIHHKAFSLSYSSSYVMPSWVTYKVTNPNVDKSKVIKGKYIPNPNVTTRSATKKDYKDGGYLMAQLVNYWDISDIDGAVEESFYMTNIAPMKRAFYLHMWLKTEDLVRLWVKDSKELHIVCAPINKDSPFQTLGKNKVSVPKRYYKVVYDAKKQKAIGFLFKNGVSSGSLKSYSHPVDKIEEETGIDFFPELDEEVAKTIESKVDYDFWKFKFEGIEY